MFHLFITGLQSLSTADLYLYPRKEIHLSPLGEETPNQKNALSSTSNTSNRVSAGSEFLSCRGQTGAKTS